MAYGSRGFSPFSFGGFPCIYCCLIVVNLLLLDWLCCWINCLLNLFLAHKEGKVIFRTIVFGSLSQQSGIKAWLFGVFFVFFLCENG